MTRQRWPALGAALAIPLGLFDGLLFELLDVEMTVGRHDVTWLVVGFYLLSFMIVGWLFGRVLAQRADLREAEAREAQLAKLAALGRLATGVAHEVRNPLAVIRSSTALIAEGLDPGDAGGQTAAQFVDAEIERLDGFIAALLDYARPRPVEAIALSWAELLVPVEPVLRATAEARGARFELNSAEAGRVLADPEQLGQAVISLVVNASEAAVGQVIVRAGPDAIIEVADDGPGVEPEDAGRIFEPFFTTKAQGTGLGLAMAARIVEAHGGRLALVDGAGLGPAGAGACFRIELPV